MAATLDGLPAELLYMIGDSGSHWKSPQASYEKLRLVCKTIDQKIGRHYGQRWCKDTCVQLDQAGLVRIQAMSRGQIAFHVQTLTISCRTLLTWTYNNESSDSSGTEKDSWLENGYRISADGTVNHYPFNETTFQLLADGTCADTLGSALLRLPNLERVYIIPPSLAEGLKIAYIEQIKLRWTIAMKTLLSIIMSKGKPLRVLAFKYPRRALRLAVHASVLEHVGIYMKQLNALTNLDLNFTADENKANTSHHVGILASMLKASPQLSNVALGFGSASKAPDFFKQLTIRLQPLSLRRLDLYQLQTRKKYLRNFIRLTSDTLEALTLDYISMDGGSLFVEFVREELDPKEVRLRCINVGEQGMFFDEISLERPVCVPENRWRQEKDDWLLVKHATSPQHEIILRQEDGDDMDFWLVRIIMYVEWGNAWTWGNVGYS